METGDDKDLRIATSISLLDGFLESQQKSLDKLREDIKRLEELKSQAMAEPTRVFETIMNNSSQAYLKHSEACISLDTSLPDLDWSLFPQIDCNNTDIEASSNTRNSRANRLKSEIISLNQSLATLPALPADLLDIPENKGKKRKRVEIPQGLAPLSLPVQSGGLRLPYSVRRDSSAHSRTISSTSQQPLEQYQRSTSCANSSSGPQEPPTPVTPLDPVSHFYTGSALPQSQTWASKATSTPVVVHSPSDSRPGSPMSDVELLTEVQPNGATPQAAQAQPPTEPPSVEEELPATFKKNWSLDEQHTLERLLVEIPSTVKFRWVKISEAMGGTRTPRQVASRVQKYYEKMKKLGVAVDSAEMGGGGRGGSKATQDLGTPIRKSTTARLKGQSTRGMPKTGPQYTKSGRRR
ncbi:hypothetical protein FS749_011003 [Ceratobasidium sp. UAMH 11750]|nr:hypothetical protein FS749_011003 [Ceratobasidium sp. UAMH 11750]